MNLNTYLFRKLIGKHWFVKETNPESFDQCDEYLDAKIKSIPKGKSFIFLADPHRRAGLGNVMNSPALIGYIRAVTGIKTVILGGDYVGREPNKYLALQEMTSYINEMRAVAGDDLIVIMGNHDLNTANVPVEAYEKHILPYEQVEKALVSHLDRECEDVTERLNKINCSAEVKNELEHYSRLHYHIDDNEARIRYIIINTGCPKIGNCVFDTFGISAHHEIVLQFDWLYETLKSTPEGYDVVIGGHQIFGFRFTTLPPLLLDMAKIISAFRTKSKVTVENPFTENENLNSYYAAGAHEYDFSNVKASGRVVVLGADRHEDEQVKADYDEQGNFAVSMYEGEELSDSAVVVNVTQSDAYGCVNYYEETYKMAPGTNTEQCFDVVTICPDGDIKFTRIGAGIDRYISVKHK